MIISSKKKNEKTYVVFIDNDKRAKNKIKIVAIHTFSLLYKILNSVFCCSKKFVL